MKLTIERMTYGPDAIAHDGNGKAVFVRGGTPGDYVEAEILSEGSSFSRARIAEVLEPGPNRISSPCPLSDECGGCPWASLARTAQLEAKRSCVIDALTRIGHFSSDEAEKLVATCRHTDEAWGYRNKIELAFSRSSGRSMLGMHALGDNHVLKANACPLLDKHFARIPRAVAGALTYLSNSHDLSFERIGIRASRRTKNVEIALWTTPGPFPRAQAAKILNDALKTTSVVRVLTKGPSKARRIAGVERLSGSGNWQELIGDNRMSFSAPSFFQVNTAGAEQLISLVIDALQPTAEDIAMDLYSGAGTFTLPLAQTCDFVYAVESYGPAVRDVRRNLETANLTNVDAQGGDAGREFPDDEADIIVVDPPRSGLSEQVVELLCEQPARAIAYVSCDPATLSRDLARFRLNGAFDIASITPVDLFPQTFHVETVTHLVRSNRRSHS